MDKPTALPAPPERAAGPTEGHSAHAGARGLASRGPEPPRGPWETPALLSQPHLMGRGPPATEGPPPRPPAHRTSGTTQGAATLLTRAERAGSPVGGHPAQPLRVHGPRSWGLRGCYQGQPCLFVGTGALTPAGDTPGECWGRGVVSPHSGPLAPAPARLWWERPPPSAGSSPAAGERFRSGTAFVPRPVPVASGPAPLMPASPMRAGPVWADTAAPHSRLWVSGAGVWAWQLQGPGGAACSSPDLGLPSPHPGPSLL